MQNTVRTTIRLRKNLFDQSRLLAVKKDTTIQEIINNTLAIGFSHVTDLNTTKTTLGKIEKFRLSLSGRAINLKQLLEASKQNLK